MKAEWHKQDEVLTPYDMRHFLANCMYMCSAGPDCEAYRKCIADLSDVFFKPMRGERDRLLADLIPRFGGDASRRFSRKQDWGGISQWFLIHPVVTLTLPCIIAQVF